VKYAEGQIRREGRDKESAERAFLLLILLILPWNHKREQYSEVVHSAAARDLK